MSDASRPIPVTVENTPNVQVGFNPGILLQGSCTCGVSPGSDGECERCHNKILQRDATHSYAPQVAPPIVHDALSSSGKPLQTNIRSFMESQFNHDFSRVRLHTGAIAAKSAQAVNAKAYTVGNNVVFGRGYYAPTSRKGISLIGHELTHVIQQQNSGASRTTNLRIESSSHHNEIEAQATGNAIFEEDSHDHISTKTAYMLQRQIEETETVTEQDNRLSESHSVRDFQRTYRDVFQSYTNLSLSIYSLRDTLNDYGIGLLDYASNPSILIRSFQHAFARFERADSTLDREISFTRLRSALHRAQLVLQASNNLIVFQQQHRRTGFAFDTRTIFSSQRSRTLSAFNSTFQVITDQEANLGANEIREEANRYDERVRRGRIRRRQRRERQHTAERAAERNTLIEQATADDQFLPNIIVNSNVVRARGIELSNDEVRAVSVVDPISLREVSEPENVESTEISRERRLRELVSESLGHQSPLLLTTIINHHLSEEGREIQRQYRGLIIQVARRLIAQRAGQFVREMMPLIGQGAGTGRRGNVSASRDVLNHEKSLNNKLAQIRLSAIELDHLDNPTRRVSDRLTRIEETSLGLPYDREGENSVNAFRRGEMTSGISLAINLHQSRNRQAEVLENQIVIWRNAFPFLREIPASNSNTDAQVRRLTITGFRRVMGRFRDAAQLIQTEEISPFSLLQAVRIARNSLPPDARRIAQFLEVQEDWRRDFEDMAWNRFEIALAFTPVVGNALSSIVGIVRGIHQMHQLGIRDTIAQASLIEGAPFLGVTESSELQRAIGVLSIALNGIGLGIDFVPSSVMRSAGQRIFSPATVRILAAERQTESVVNATATGVSLEALEQGSRRVSDVAPHEPGTEMLESASHRPHRSSSEGSSRFEVALSRQGTRSTQVNLTEEVLVHEHLELQQIARTQSRIVPVTDPELINSGYRIEIALYSGAIYRRRSDGTWCRFNSPEFCGLYVGDDVERRALAAIERSEGYGGVSITTDPSRLRQEPTLRARAENEVLPPFADPFFARRSSFQTHRRELRRRLLRFNRGFPGYRWEAHHIIPQEFNDHPVLLWLRDNGGWDHNSLRNGIALPMQDDIPGAGHLPFHQSHPRFHGAYNSRVWSSLQDIHYRWNNIDIPVAERIGDDQIRREVNRLIIRLRWNIESGRLDGLL